MLGSFGRGCEEVSKRSDRSLRGRGRPLDGGGDGRARVCDGFFRVSQGHLHTRWLIPTFYHRLDRITRLQGDLIILGGSPSLSNPDALPSSLPASAFDQETLLARYAFSQALSRSTALSALEVSLENYLSSVSSLPLSLQRTGKPGLGRRALVQKLGELLKFRQGLNLNRENFYDTPDFYWAEPVLEGLSLRLVSIVSADKCSGYFNSLSNALEVRARIRSVNEKITYAAEVPVQLFVRSRHES